MIKFFQLNWDRLVLGSELVAGVFLAVLGFFCLNGPNYLLSFLLIAVSVLLFSLGLMLTMVAKQSASLEIEPTFDLVAEGVVITDNTGVVLYANPALQDWYPLEIGQALPAALAVNWSAIATKPIALTWQLANQQVVQGYSYALNKHQVIFILDSLKTPEKIKTAVHELRNPLTGVQAYLEALQSNQVDDVQTKQHFVEVAYQESQRMADMLTELSKAEDEPVQLAAINLTSLVNSILDRFQTIISQHDLPHQLIRQLDQTDLWVQANAPQLIQVVDNLLQNALKYSPAGGVIIVKVFAKQGQGWLVIQDHGLGIAAQNLPHIFDRHFRVSEPAVQKQPGSGLGLSLVKNLVEQMHGQISVTSTLGAGTIFSVKLPQVSKNARIAEKSVKL
ncbi:sensor histidine kinase [Convivina intestini]|uniref:histidine kinase n=1 Tax=Convivina intestini TaxID=1505726 RepID=A0A2U1D9K1_9LACO|nr:ATP-binding protein [Convivina intestini]PVY84309.1 phospho-acceptor domain-containing protein [Convivina intestini]CAH1855483.1 Adaptive-response sensory-kinase SasA [Convivina intestini]SDB94162.1 His Kinase A (phospho-acceptor) domain-containing protein [Leuconostocaceae bacterium R-53105]